MLVIVWLCLAGAVQAEFNTSIEVALDLLSPAMDMDWNYWTYDDPTGYAANIRTAKSSGAMGASFIAQRYRVFGQAATRPEVYASGNGEQVGSSSGTGVGHKLLPTTGILTEYEAAEAMMMSVRLSHLPHGLLTLHNITVDIPVHTQA